MHLRRIVCLHVLENRQDFRIGERLDRFWVRAFVAKFGGWVINDQIVIHGERKNAAQGNERIVPSLWRTLCPVADFRDRGVNVAAFDALDVAITQMRIPHLRQNAFVFQQSRTFQFRAA
jgi:hypothetical protein